MWDIIIAVSLGLVTAVMAYMGVHVTLHPPGEENKGRWRAGFIVVAVIACVLIGIQAYRAHRSSEDLQAEIAKQGTDIKAEIHKEGDRPVKVEIRQPPTPEPQDSLRKRALQLAKETDTFWQQRQKSAPGYIVTNKMTPEEQQAKMAPAQAYMAETTRLWGQRFAPNVMGLVQEFKAKGLDVSSVESCAPYGFCQTPIWLELRMLAGRLDAQGNVKR